MAIREKFTPRESALNKVYFVNLFTRPIVYGDFQTAKRDMPKLTALAEKLSAAELNYLIDKIESIL